MVSLITIPQAQEKLARHLRQRRLDMELTQAGLAARAGVALPTLRKFEQKGVISLEGLLKLLMVLGGVDEMIEAIKPAPHSFASIDDVLKEEPKRKRGRRT